MWVAAWMAVMQMSIALGVGTLILGGLLLVGERWHSDESEHE